MNSFVDLGYVRMSAYLLYFFSYFLNDIEETFIQGD